MLCMITINQYKRPLLHLTAMIFRKRIPTTFTTLTLSQEIKNQHIKAKTLIILTIHRQVRVLALVPAHRAINRVTRVMDILLKLLSLMGSKNNTSLLHLKPHHRLHIYHQSKNTVTLPTRQTTKCNPRRGKQLRRSEDSRKRKVLSLSKLTTKPRLST